MPKVYLDTETVGLHGLPILLQYAIDDSDVILHNFWTTPFQESLDLIEWICECDIVCFNLAFDFFHLYKIHTVFQTFLDKNPNDLNSYPENHINELGIIEEKARFADYCLKPKSAVDLMLIARRGKYQTLMERDPIVIRKVPTPLAYSLAKELEKRVPFDDIYFAKAKDKYAPRWKIYDITKNDGTIDANFKTIKLIFKASGALKNLYRHAFNITENIFTYKDIELGKEWWPVEYGYAPFALAVAPDAPKTGDWKWSWPEVIHEHITHWGYNENARKYAGDDVIYTRRLYLEHFNSPEPNVDSTLACMVACCRWSGYAIDISKLKNLKEQCLLKLGFDPEDAKIYKHRPVNQETVNRIGHAVMDPRPVKRYISQVLSPDERLAFTSTKKTVLEEISKWIDDDGKKHPAAIRAQEVLDARISKKEIEVYDKLIQAGRFHASFKVIGALSSRMSGADDLNAQGIKHQTYVRECFPLADPPKGNDLDMILCGGDFKSFEVSIAAKVFDDSKLDAALNAGKKIHALFAMELFPGKSYEEICATEGQDPDLYDKGKKGIFAMFYGGNDYTLKTRLGVEAEAALAAMTGIGKKFPGIKRHDDKIRNDFGALIQSGGIGTKVEWREPKQFIESFLGFRRYFTLEIRVAKALYELARDIPQEWRDLKIKVLRRDRIQTAHGAVSSALYGSAFGICSRMIRAAKNHTIQSVGAEVTKTVQAAAWELQPISKAPWIVKPMNIHDEIMCPTRKGYENRVELRVQQEVTKFRDKIPLLKIDWFNNIPNWASKKGVKKNEIHMVK